MSAAIPILLIEGAAMPGRTGFQSPFRLAIFCTPCMGEQSANNG